MLVTNDHAILRRQLLSDNANGEQCCLWRHSLDGRDENKCAVRIRASDSRRKTRRKHRRIWVDCQVACTWHNWMPSRVRLLSSSFFSLVLLLTLGLLRDWRRPSRRIFVWHPCVARQYFAWELENVLYSSLVDFHWSPRVSDWYITAWWRQWWRHKFI